MPIIQTVPASPSDGPSAAPPVTEARPPSPEPRRGDLGPFARRALVVIGLVALVAVVLFGAYALFDVLLLTFGGLLFAVFLDGVAGFLRDKTGMPRPAALGVTLAGIVALLVGAGWLLGPDLVEQGAELGNALASGYEELRRTLEESDLAPLADQLPTGQEMAERAGALANEIPGLVSSIVGGLSTLFVVIIVGIYFTLKPSLYVRGVVALVPISKRERAHEVLQRVGVALKKWLVGQFILMAFVGTLITIGLFLLGIPLAFALGFLAFLLDFIPIIGPFIAAAPAILVAFLVGPEQALYVALLYFGVQQVESYLLAPKVQERVVDLPPVVLILAQVLMGGVAGLLGITLATPLAVAVIVLIQMLYVEDTLGDHSVDVLGSRDAAEEDQEAEQEKRRAGLPPPRE
ncbi:MAG: AI-2E family transporter [Rubricoccaceae bacterium]